MKRKPNGTMMTLWSVTVILPGILLPIADLQETFEARVRLPSGQSEQVKVRAMSDQNAREIIKGMYCGAGNNNCITEGPWLSRNTR